MFAVGLMLLASGVSAESASPTLEIQVHARALAPGEPMRVVVTSTEPLRTLRGSFLSRDLSFAPESAGQQGDEAWTAWSIVDLDASAGETRLTVSSTTVGGRETSGATAVTIVKKAFPTETLKVDEKYVAPPKEVQARIAREQAALGAVYARRTPALPAAAPFQRPVSGEPTSIFGLRRVFNGTPKAPHPGLDLRAAPGTRVLCSGPGSVALARDLYFSGNTVIVDHGGGLFTIYAHLSRIDVKEGAAVTAGRMLGLSGATGRVTGPHLHWGGKVGNLPFDPTALLDPALFAPG